MFKIQTSNNLSSSEPCCSNPIQTRLSTNAHKIRFLFSAFLNATLLQLCIYISCNLQNVLVLKGISFFCLQRMLAHCSATLFRYVADGLKVNSPVDSSGLLHSHANPLAWQSQKLPPDTNTSTHTAEPTRVTQRHWRTRLHLDLRTAVNKKKKFEEAVTNPQ